MTSMSAMPTTMCAAWMPVMMKYSEKNSCCWLRQRRIEVRSRHQVVLELLGVLEVLDDEEGRAEQDREDQVHDLAHARSDLRRSHRQRHRQRAADQHQRC